MFQRAAAARLLHQGEAEGASPEGSHVLPGFRHALITGSPRSPLCWPVLRKFKRHRRELFYFSYCLCLGFLVRFPLCVPVCVYACVCERERGGDNDVDDSVWSM